MKLNKKLITIIIALLIIAGAATYITQQEEPVEPTISEVETPIEAPVETPTETPVEGDTAVEGQPTADETTATGNLGGSVGENNFGMTNLMDSIKDNNQTDVEHSLDLEEQKQETPIEGAVGSSDGSGTGTGNGTGTGVPVENEGSSAGSSVGGNSGTGTQPQTPSGNGNLTQEQKDFINKETAEGENKYNDDNKYTSKEEVSKDSMLSDVDGWNSKIGAWEATDDLGNKGFMFPNGGWMEYDVAKALGLV